MTSPRRTVLVTGAGGKTGRAVIAALQRRGARPRALVRDPARVADLGVETVVGDQREVAPLAAALAGRATGTGRADAVYAIAPNVSPDEVVMGRALLAAADHVGVPRVVFHSVIHPQRAAMLHHRDKGRVEELLIGSGLAWTILQPNAYLQNVLAGWEQVRAGTYRTPYSPARALAMVDLHDVATVAARTLVEDLGVHATFELSGPEALTGDRIAEIAARSLGTPVVARGQDPDAWRDGHPDLPGPARERLHAMFVAYDRHGSPGDATVLRALLGREPRHLATVLGERR